jgi:adenylate cyclase
VKAFSKTIQAAVAAIGLTLVVALLLHLPYFSDMEDETSDHLVSLRYWLDKKEGAHATDARIVTAAIDEDTIQDLGAWPLPRAIHGGFLKVLAPENPAALGWDIQFTETAPQPSDDQALVEGAALFPHMVTASKRGEGTSAALTDDQELLPTRPFKHVVGDTSKLLSSQDAILPVPPLRKETYFGFADEPGRVRRVMPLVVNINGKILPSFDLQVLLQYWGVDPDRVTVELGKAVTIPIPQSEPLQVPIDEAGFMVLNYRGKLEDFHPISYGILGKGLEDKLDNQPSVQRDHLPPLAHAIVIVGVTLSGTDGGVTPLEATSPLVVAHLNVINNVLQHDFLRLVSPWVWMPLYALFIFGVASRMLHLRVVPMLGVDLLAMVLVAIAAFGLLFWGNRQIPVAMPEIGLVLLGILVPARGFFGEEREKARIKGIMQAYLSDKVMQKILEHPDNLKLGGIKQEITIMFCDIRGFTAYCDERDPQETMDVLNEYMETMTQVVFRHDGTIDKYIGDCIMAFWNAPELQPDHAQKAVRCAMEMRLALADFSSKRAGTGLESFECGIGIHTGEALVGNMGSSLKRNYTAMGSTVNLASRLESLTKRLKERIVISEDTLHQLQGDLPIIDRGDQTVAGVARPVHVYAVVSDEEYAGALQAASESQPAEAEKTAS